jgi:hypothetical protein
MSYATADQFAAQLAHVADDLDIPEDLDGLLQRASGDLDAYLCWPPPVGPVLVPPDPVDRIDTSQLTWWQRDALARATCQQAAYRLTVAELDLIEGAPRVTAVGGALTFAPTAPDLIGRSALVCLSGAGLLRYRTGTAPPDDDLAA